MVPLIAADELPEGIRLQGVSRSLTLGEVRGMEYLGGFPPTTTVFNVESGLAHLVIPCAPQAQSRFQAPDAMIRKFRSTATPNTPVLGTTFPYQSNMPRLEASMTHPGSPKPQQPSLSVMDAIAGSDPVTTTRIGYNPRRPLPPSGAEPEQEKKVYCTYWIRTGECDYTQQGCLYKHEMLDLETLKKIGFISEPRWWKEKCAVKPGAAPSSTITRGPTWMQRRMNAIHSDDDANGESDAGSDPSKEEGILRKLKVSFSQPPSRALPASPEVSTPIPSAGPAPAVKQKPFVNWSSHKPGDIPVLHTFPSPSSSESSKSDITLTSLLSPHVTTGQMTIENQRRMPRLSTHLKAMEASESSLPDQSDLISLQFDESKEQLPARSVYHGSVPQQAMAFHQFLQERGSGQRDDTSGNIFSKRYTERQPDSKSASKPYIPNLAPKYNTYFPQNPTAPQPPPAPQKRPVAQGSSQKSSTSAVISPTTTTFPTQGPTKTLLEDTWRNAQQTMLHETMDDQKHPKQRFGSGLMASVHALSDTTLQPPELSVNASNPNTSSKDACLYQTQVHATRHQQKHPLNKDGSPVDALASNLQVVSVVRLENGSSSKSAVAAGHEKASHSKSQSGATRFSKRRFQSGGMGGAGSALPPAK